MITLPDAIRKGSVFQPQAFGQYIIPPSDGGPGYCTCTVGAAVAGVYDQPLTPEELPKNVVEFLEESTGCDLDARIAEEDLPFENPSWTAYTLFDVIEHLNDRLKWEREKIADWVESWLLKQNSHERWEQQ